MNKAFFENNYLILSNIWKNRYKLAIFPFVFAACFFFFHSIIPEKYEVNLSLLIQDTEELNPQLSDLSISSIQRKTIFYEHLIKSDQVLDKSINDNSFFQFENDIQKKEIKDRIRNGLKLSQTSYNKNDKNVFNISFKWDDRNEIEDLFFEINESFICAFNDSHIESINKSRSFINQQLKMKKEEILLSEKNIIDFKLKHKDIVNELMRFDYKENSTLDQKITEKEILFLGIKEKYEVIQKQLIRENPVKKMVQLKIAEHKKTLSNYNLIYTEHHSLVIKEKQIIKELELELQSLNESNTLNIEQIKQYLSENIGTVPYLLIDKTSELENVIIEKNKIERELMGLKKIKEKQDNGLKNFGDLYIQLKELKQDLKIKEEKYNKLLEKEEFIKITEELKRFEESDTIQIMNKDSLEIKSLKPPKIIYILGGYIFGVFLILSISIIEFILNQNIIKQREISEILNSKVISRVPHISKK